MSEKLCLKWNDFQENVNTAFGDLRGDLELTDVTLACEDDQQIEAHKVILASSSPVFQSMLKKNKHFRPMIFMKGVKFEDLCAIVDFLYLGEANVFQENLDSFLGIAEDLKLKGLAGKTENLYNKTDINSIDPVPLPAYPIPIYNKKKKTREGNLSNFNDQTTSVQLPIEGKIALPDFSGNLKELDEKVKSLMDYSENLAPSGPTGSKAKICKVCGKEGAGIAIRDHIEANHLEGLSFGFDFLI